MSPATRITRGSLAAAEDFASLSSRDRLIFSQAVYEYGARQTAWAEIAKVLSKHPLISRPKNFFNVQSCIAIYNYLMKEVGIERTDLCEAKKSPINAQLAQRFYRDRVTELRDEIAAEEDRFKILVTQVEEIRAGKWDDKILSKLNGAEISLDLPLTVLDKSPESVKTEQIDGNAAMSTTEAQAAEEPQTHATPRAPASEGEVSMDVSSPVRPSSPPPEKSSPQEEIPKVSEEVQAEPTSTESELGPVRTASEEQQPASPEHVPKTRSRTRRGQPEAEEAQVPEDVKDEEVPPTDEEEQVDVQMGEVEKTEEADQDIIPDEATPEPAATHEDEHVDVVSHESTPAPKERIEGKRRASDVDVIETPRDKKRPRDKSESVDYAESPATPSALPSGSGAKDAKERKRFQSVILMLHAQITAHRNGTIFHQPIKPNEAPDYHDIVKRPMDLKTVKNKVKDGRISTSNEYQRDIYLMFANSLMYNRPNSDIYMMAEEMMLDSEAEIQNFQQTEAYNLRTRG